MPHDLCFVLPSSHLGISHLTYKYHAGFPYLNSFAFHLTLPPPGNHVTDDGLKSEISMQMHVLFIHVMSYSRNYCDKDSLPAGLITDV